MELKVNWKELMRQLWAVIWPFIAGAVGGLFTSCTIAGIGQNFI